MRRRPGNHESRVSAWSLSACALLLLSCAEADRSLPIDDQYRESIEQSRAERISNLTADDGWLNLVGLFWLETGSNSFGFGPDNDIVLEPSPGLEAPPDHLGTIEVDGTEARLQPSPDTGLQLDGQPATAARLVADTEGEPSKLELGPITAYVIVRGDKLGLRVRDRQSARLAAFDGIEHYPLDGAWRLAARFEPAPEGRTLPIPNVTGFEYDQESAGAVVFDHEGAEYRLDVIGGDIAEPLLVVVGDQTNGAETYGGGRYLYVDVADGDEVELDLNRLYNPPCVFTPYATCPLPPPQNRLPFPVRAGEKKIAKDA